MVDLTGIKNIVFDFGNVIMDIDFNLTVTKFKELGFQNIEQFLHDYRSLGFFSDYQEGKISNQVFFEKVRENSGMKLTDQDIETAWNAMLIDYSSRRLNALERLKPNYRLFLLSNTNQIHYDNFACRVPGKKNLSFYFEKEYYSHQIGMSKPSLEIYEYILTDGLLKPEETFFIDDLRENIDGALKAGMKAQLAVFPDEWLGWFGMPE